MSLKILHVIQTLTTGGAGRAALAMARRSRALAGHCHRLVSLCPCDPRAVALAGEHGVEVVAAPSEPEWSRELETCDVVLVHWWNTPEMARFLERPLPPVRTAVWLHVGGSAAPQRIAPEVLESFDHVAACSPHTWEAPAVREVFRRRGESGASMLFAAAEIDRFLELEPTAHEGIVVGYAGTVEPTKMHADFAALCAGVHDKDVRFAVCGGPAHERLRAEAAAAGIAARLEIHGPVPDVAPHLRRWDVFGYPLCPDTYAASELVVQEAMAAGLPCVVFPHGGVAKLVEDGRTGLVVHDAQGYADAVARLAGDAALRRRLGAAAREHARAEFSPDRWAAAWNARFEELAGRARTAHPEGLVPGKGRSPARRFADSLLEDGTDFLASLEGGTHAVEAEERIARCSALVRSHGSGGILQFRNAHPDDPHLRLWSALVLEDEGQLSHAAGELTDALSMGLVDARVLWHAGRVSEGLGAIPTARDCYAKVHATDPDFAPVRERLEALEASRLAREGVTVAVYGRNDAHGQNLHKRACISLNCLAEQLDPGRDEILFVDCNSPDDVPTFPEAVADLLTGRARSLLRVLRLRPSQFARLSRGAAAPVLEALCRNVALRRASPERAWVLSTNTDIVLRPRAGKRLTEIVKDLDEGLYGLPRFDVPQGLWESLDRTDPQGCVEAMGGWADRFGLRVAALAPWDFIRWDNPGDFQLALREDLVAIGGFDESMTDGPYHIDSNLARRLSLLRGAVRSLESELESFHCDHSRQEMARQTGAAVKGNDWNLKVASVSRPDISSLQPGWGAEGIEVEEIRLDGSVPLARQLASLVPADASCLVLPPGDGTPGSNTGTALSRLLPFLADHLLHLPESAVVGLLGQGADLAQALAALCSRPGRPAHVLVLEDLGVPEARVVSGSGFSRGVDLVVVDPGSRHGAVDHSRLRGQFAGFCLEQSLLPRTERARVLLLMPHSSWLGAFGDRFLELHRAPTATWIFHGRVKARQVLSVQDLLDLEAMAGTIKEPASPTRSAFAATLARLGASVSRPAAVPASPGRTSFLAVYREGLPNGWDVLLSAWARAFGPHDPVQLLLACPTDPDVPSAVASILASMGKDAASVAPIRFVHDAPEASLAALAADVDVSVCPWEGPADPLTLKLLDRFGARLLGPLDGGFLHARPTPCRGATPEPAEELAAALARCAGTTLAGIRGDAVCEQAGSRIGYDLRTLEDADSSGRGIGQYALHHLRALARRAEGLRLTVVHPGARPDPAWASSLEGLPLEWLPQARYRPGMFDLVHVPDPMGLQPGYASPLEFFAGERFSVLFHDLIPLTQYRERMGLLWPSYLARLERWKASGSVYLCNSAHTAAELGRELGLDGQDLAVVGAGRNVSDEAVAPVSLEALRRRLGLQGDYCLYVGVMDPHKNFETAFQALVQAAQRHPVTLVATGRETPSSRQWREAIDKAGLGHLLVQTGFLERAELEALYAGARALLFPSRAEGFGFPALEAMACGCPVVCSDAASLPEVVGEAALRHGPDDVSGMADSILHLCRDAGLREELVAKGRERARGFTWDAVADRTISVWKRMLSAPKPLSEAVRGVEAAVNWISPVFDPSGYASESRAFLLALEASSSVPSVRGAGRHSPRFAAMLPGAERAVLDRQLDRQWNAQAPFVLNMPASGFSRLSAQPHVGRTTFETDGLPADWIAKCNAMDEIWVPSQFNLETFRAAGVKVPLLRVPEGVDTERFRPGLAPLELPGERRGTTFLSVFEWTHRKGWDVLLAAWADAFKAGDDVELVLRAYPANAIEGDPAQWVEDRICQFLSSLGTSREACAPITVLAAQIPEGDMPRLYAAADVYLAPSRGEGWGRPHMEAMSAGLPVIATRWSGNLDFMDDSNSWLLDVETLEEIDAREEFEFYRGQKWARPSTDHLAGLMRRAAASPDGRRALGEKARKDMVARWDWKKIAPLAALRLEEIRAGVPAERSRLPEAAPVPCCLAVTDNVEARRRPVRWCGPLFNASGHARQGREAVLGLTEIGVQVSLDPLFNEQSFLEGLERDEPAARRWGRLVQNPPKSGVLVCCDLPTDGGGVLDVYADARRRSPEQKACVAWCTFEADRLPDGWVEKLRGVDEVWVPSTFNREVFAKAGVLADRLFVVPEGIDPEPYRAATPRVLPEAAGYTFLSVFQWSLRKGWDVLLEAWAKAFAPDDDVQLVLRCSPFSGNAAPIQEQAEAFLRSRGLSWESMAPVVLLADPLPEHEMPGLYAACDCFVLPSRGEGWGLPYLEAMAAGRPCIATAWAGPMDFLHEGNAWLVPPEGLVPPSGEALLENPFLSADQRWAGLSAAAFAQALRHARDHRDEGRAKGARGRKDVRERWTPVHTAHAMLERLKLLPRESAAIAQDGPQDAMLGQELSNHEGTERNMAETPLHVRWEGSQFVHHSLAHINREVCLELALRGHDMALQPYEPDEFRPEPGSRLEPLSQLVLAPLEEAAQVHVRHQWPPQLTAPEEGRWVAIQPWEFGPVPRSWVEAWKDDLDELWVPSQFVKDGYVQSGMPQERVAVIPNGVDADRFRPDAKPLDIPSPKSFRFLFVGGTIYRKGIDLLLEAYGRAFRDTDDVTLVVKDMGGKTFYRGQTADDLFERFGSRPGNPELIVIDEPLSDDELPGLYGACTCLVHPYRGEGFGMPILEAMSAGLPVIVTDGGPAKEFCSPESAWFVPAVRKDLPGRHIGEMECAGQPWLLEPDIEALARLMRVAYEDRAGCQAKGARGREAVLAGYTWRHMTDRVEARLNALSQLPRRRKAPLQPAKNLLDPSLRNTQADGDDQELNLLLMQIEPALGRGDIDEARDLVNEAVERFPEHPLSWLTRAMLLRGAGKAVQGLADTERSIRCRETPEALQEAIECYLALRKQADAERLLKRLEREYPQWCATARLGLGRPWIGGKVRHGGSGGSAKPKPKTAKKARK